MWTSKSPKGTDFLKARGSSHVFRKELTVYCNPDPQLRDVHLLDFDNH